MNIYKSIKRDAISTANALLGIAGFKIEMSAPSPRSNKTAVSDSHYTGMDVPNEDAIIESKGIEGYRKMRRDAEVSADTDIRLAAMIPGLQILPADIDEDAKASSDFINSVMKSMDGDLEYTFRDQMCDETIVTGLLVAEPEQMIIELPDYGKVLGLKSIQVRPSEGFTGNIETDDSGNIIALHQITMEGTKDVTLDDVLYYAFRGQPWNPYGRSIYHSAYDWYLLKQELMRLFADFTTVNASGIKIYDIPDDDFNRDKATALDRLKRLGGRASIVKKLSHKLEFMMPTGTAGYNFIRGIKELCNVEIRKAILYDELINAEGVRTGSRSAREVSENVMYSVMATQGKAFCTSMAEQLFRRVLDWNGFHNWPTPRLVPEATPKRDADPAPILQAYTSAVQAGVLPVPSAEVAEQISRQVLRPMGVDIVENAPDEAKKDDTEAREHIHFAGAPPGRQRSDILKLKQQAIAAENKATVALTDAWKSLIPKQKKAINSAIFDASGQWKSKNYATIRKAVSDAITVGGAGLRKGMTDGLFDRYGSGYSDAEKIVPINASVAVTPVMITPTAARSMLSQEVFLTLEEIYGRMSREIYYQLENALNGAISEREAMARIGEYLETQGINAGRATTIVNTSLNNAYNQGRMSLFSQISDPDGVTPGGIIGYEFSAVMDDATTDICLEYNGQFFKVDDPSLPQPGLHYGCRSVLIPVFTGEDPWGGKEWTTFDKSKSMSSGITEGFGGN